MNNSSVLQDVSSGVPYGHSAIRNLVHDDRTERYGRPIANICPDRCPFAEPGVRADGHAFKLALNQRSVRCAYMLP